MLPVADDGHILRRVQRLVRVYRISGQHIVVRSRNAPGKRAAAFKVSTQECRVEREGTKVGKGGKGGDRWREAGVPACFGLVWFGLVWFGLVWFGLVWFGAVRSFFCLFRFLFFFV
jgi:hypothetical protein